MFGTKVTKHGYTVLVLVKLNCMFAMYTQEVSAVLVFFTMSGNMKCV